MVRGDVPVRDDRADAAVLRDAVRVLHARGPEKQPFSLRVIIRTLNRAADRIEAKARAREQGQDVPGATTRGGTSGCAEGR